MKLYISIIAFTLLFTTSLIAKTHKLSVSRVEDHQGKACNVAFGEYRKQAKKECEKQKLKLDYDSLKPGDCIGKEMGGGKFKATYNIQFECTKF